MVDLTALIRMLSEKTAQRKLSWRKAADGQTLRATLADGSTFEVQSDASTVGITTKSADGKLIPELTVTGLGAFMPNQAVLAELARLAARSAAGEGSRQEAGIVNAVRQL